MFDYKRVSWFRTYVSLGFMIDVSMSMPNDLKWVERNSLGTWATKVGNDTLIHGNTHGDKNYEVLNLFGRKTHNSCDLSVDKHAIHIFAAPAPNLCWQIYANFGLIRSPRVTASDFFYFCEPGTLRQGPLLVPYLAVHKVVHPSYMLVCKTYELQGNSYHRPLST